jgi:hypothetical protein
MKKNIRRILGFSIGYLAVLSVLLLMLHILNSLSPLSPNNFSLATGIVISISAFSWLLGIRIYYANKKEK